MLRKCLWAITILCCCHFCNADTVILNQGQKLTGDIITEKEKHLYLDVGITILKIQKDEILQYQYSDQVDSNAPESKIEDQPADPCQPEKLKTWDQLYYTCDSEQMTIEQSVKQVSQAVVKITTPGGMGSGFFLNEDGYLITNYHVIEKETKIEVTVFQKTKDGFEKKKFKKVRIDAINPFIDLALLKIEDLGETKVKYVCLGDIEETAVGQEVFAIGNPLGLERTVTNGVISTKNRAFSGLVYIQTNADINPGNSGGPLFNLAGQVVGVTNMGYIFLGGLGFAIPVNYVKHFIENRDAFAYDQDSPNTGFRYIQPDKRRNKNKPPLAKPMKNGKKKRK
ncbi:S1C family serine protease [Planctomycetota bacterium]